MNWKETDKILPDTTSGSSSNTVLVWIIGKGDKVENGFPTVAFYSKVGNKWYDGGEALSDRNWIVTHWAEIERPV